MVLDMQARLLLDMLGKGIESALINPSALVPDPWQVSSETLTSIDPEAVAVEPALVPCVQVCFGLCCNHVLLILFNEKIYTQLSGVAMVNCMVQSAYFVLYALGIHFIYIHLLRKLIFFLHIVNNTRQPIEHVILLKPLILSLCSIS